MWQVDEQISGVEYLDAALADGNGAVIVLPHSGNWDATGLWLVGYAGSFTTVVERLKPESVYRRFFTLFPSLPQAVRSRDCVCASICAPTSLPASW